MAKLTATEVRALLKKPGKYGDGNGLWLYVGKPGQARWFMHYSFRGKPRQMALGSAEWLALAEAREKALEARKLLAEGIDPIDQRRAQQAAAEVAQAKVISFAEAAEAYITSNEAAWRSEKHRWQWRATLEAAAKLIGPKPVGEITTDDVLRAIQPMWFTKPETASRLRGRVERVLSYAAVRGWRDRNQMNPALWRGHLQLVLPGKRKVRPVTHLAAVPWQEAPAFMRELRQREGFGVAALRFAILTAARSGEVRGARWEEIDGAVWTIPAARMKGGKEHRVPLSAPAVAILRAMTKLQDGSGLVFLGLKRDVPMSDMTLAAVLRRMGRKETQHGFRSTFRDWAAEATHHPNHVVEQALAHAIPSAVEAAYRRGDLFAKRIALMDDWAAFLARPAAEVVRPGGGTGRRGDRQRDSATA